MANSAQLTSGLTEIFRSAPSAAELSVFQSICDTQGLPAAFNAAVDSDGADAARTVISFYQVFYGRQPDAAGLDFWTGELESGNTSLNELADAFAVASEFNERFGDRTPTEIVFAQYRNVLGREPDFEGLNFWTNQVTSGNLSLADLGRFFATSDEAQARFDPFLDAFLVNAANGDQDYDSDLSLFEESLGDTGPVAPTGEPIRLADVDGAATGGNGADVFEAESGDLTSGRRIDGGAGADTLTVFSEETGIAVSPRMTGVETVVWTNQANDLNSVADNNVGGYGNGDGTVEVDVELDAGRIRNVTRWEDFDSRADLVIEDARDSDDVDGTFTGDIEIAMVSTDPGNVDYAIYFDQPVNTSQASSTIFIEVLDLDTANTTSPAAVSGNTLGVLNDATLSQFTIGYGGQNVTIQLDTTDPRVVGPNATYNTLRDAIQEALDADPTVGGDLVASVDGPFDERASPENSVGGGTTIFGLRIQIDSNSNTELDAISRVAFSNDPSRAIAARISDQSVIQDELIRLNIDLDDVGKGSMGGDLLAGAMSVGRQAGDDRTSDSVGIQQFDIEVDRSSQLQTINSTNNTLEVVNIVNGENNGPNNTTTAVDEQIGDLVVRGRANPADEVRQTQIANPNFDPNQPIGPGNMPTITTTIVVSSIATDSAMPGAVPQHNDFGFDDIRILNAAAMVGSVDLTAVLTDEIVEKYLNNEDGQATGNEDDVRFDYSLGTNDDELFLNISDSALIDAGTASREDFNLVVRGNGGNDSIVTNVGRANKVIDGQGQDYYVMQQFNGPEWYPNQANNDAASIRVDGGAGNDSIYTHGWGDVQIIAGAGEDVVYTDNAGAINLPTNLLNNLSRSIGEHEQIDYEVGAVWTFNDDNGGDDDTDDDGESGGIGDGFGDVSDIAGSTNDNLTVATPTTSRAAGTVYETKVTVSFFGADGDGDTAYTSTVTIPDSVISAGGVITDQELNQAIKNAVNNDPVLNKVLEAADGPGQSLAVYSKIDGVYDRNDLQIDVFEEQTTGGVTTTAVFNTAGTGYDTEGADANVDFQNLGFNSFAESDNRIVISADGANDVTVLSTNDGTTLGAFTSGNPNLNGASNEVLVFQEGNFGVETIFNFDEGDSDLGVAGAEDRFDFFAIAYAPAAANFAQGGANLSNNSVSIVAEATDGTTVGKATTNNNNAGEVADIFDNAATSTTTTTEHIFIVYDDNADIAPDDTILDSADNTGTVYLVTDTFNADATATRLGDINLIGTEWDSLTFDNFL